MIRSVRTMNVNLQNRSHDRGPEMRMRRCGERGWMWIVRRRNHPNISIRS